MIKLLFHIVNIIFVIFYLYPGSILGYLLFGNFDKQPQLTEDIFFNFFEISSNHVYAFLILSFLGFLGYFKNKKRQIVLYLIFLAIILEIFHLFIPERSFQIPDLIGNIFGIFISFIIINIFYYAKNFFN